MKIVVVLVIMCAVVSGKYLKKGPRQFDRPLPLNNVKNCAPNFEEYHKCRAESKERASKFREERRNNLTKILDACFTDNGCAAPPKPEPTVESPAEQDCKLQFRKAKKEKVRACVKSEFPDYVFGPDSQQPGHKLHFEDLEVKVDHCANKDRILECRRNAVAQYRKAKFQMKCAMRARCLVLMPEKCQDQLEKIKFKKCNCKAEVRKLRKEIRNGIVACQQVPPKPHKHPDHKCPRRGYCKAGYGYWLNDHPLEGQLASPQGPRSPLPQSGPAPAPASPNLAPPAPAPPAQVPQSPPPSPPAPAALQPGQPAAFQLGPQPLPPQVAQG